MCNSTIGIGSIKAAIGNSQLHNFPVTYLLKFLVVTRNSFSLQVQKVSNPGVNYPNPCFICQVDQPNLRVSLSFHW